MTERLSALLRDEAAALNIPPVDQAAILARGRQAGVRRRATVFLAAAAAVAVLGTGTALAIDGDGDRRADDRATDPAVETSPSRGVVAYGAGSTVVVGGTTATVPGTLHSLHYTSVGVLTRSNANDGASDGSGPETLTLVNEDGTATDLGTIPEGVGPATDPDEPVYALAEKSGDGFEAVVRDARTGEEVGSVALPDLPMSYWPVPPLALDGDIVYAGFEAEAVAFNWRTGELQPAKGLVGGIPEVRGGLTLSNGEKLADGGVLELVVSVVDAATGASVLVVPLEKGEYGFGNLSPDGRFLLFKVESMDFSGETVESTAGTETTASLSIYDLDTGEQVALTGEVFDWGWTSGSLLFKVTGKGLQVCDPITVSCEIEPAPRLSQNLRLGGNVYES